MKLLLYDIFSDDIENHAIWLDSIEGLSAACDLMKRHAKENPGPHFILCKKTNTVLASINTLLSPDVQNPSLASSMAGDIFSVCPASSPKSATTSASACTVVESSMPS